ncbi:MAG: BatD family protein, partial [Desulfobacterales bacterium]|nr:BatD family protein [Desulfobacterales bacterium]
MKIKSPVFLKIIVSLLFVILLPLTGGAQVTAKLERQVIGIDETVRVIIEADGARNTISSINTEALEKEFSILNRSSSSNFRIINGSAKASKVWTLVLEAKRTGTFTIPPFAVGKEKSNSLTLKVTDSTPETSPSNQESRDVSLEVTPLMETPAYLQGQITVSVKLFLKSQLRITDASLDEPEVEHATIKKLGKDLNYQTKRGGQSYQVIERKYAIIAEDGDKITIPPLHFQAIRLQGGSRRFAGDPFFGHFSEQRKIRVKSQPLTIALTPIPKEFNGKVWLPARAMEIMDNKDEVKELKIGEPLTRTIQIEALGLTAEQLPEIEVTAPEGSKIYLDQPELQTIVDNNALLHAVKRQSLAFIPSQTGTFTLPAITIKWWDVVNLKQRLA